MYRVKCAQEVEAGDFLNLFRFIVQDGGIIKQVNLFRIFSFRV